MEDAFTSTVHWSVTDQLGTVRHVTDDTGAIVESRTYDSFGQLLVTAGTATGLRLGHTGRGFDADAGLQYHRARWLDPQALRWASEDPIRFAAGDANVSRYVANRASSAVDPTGLFKVVPEPNISNPKQRHLWYYDDGAWIWPRPPVHVGYLDPKTGIVTAPDGSRRYWPDVKEKGEEWGYSDQDDWQEWFNEQPIDDRILTPLDMVRGPFDVDSSHETPDGKAQWREGSLLAGNLAEQGVYNAAGGIVFGPGAGVGGIARLPASTVAKLKAGQAIGRTRWPAMMIDDVVYVGGMHNEAAALAGGIGKTFKWKWGFVDLDEAGKVVKVAWGTTGVGPG